MKEVGAATIRRLVAMGGMEMEVRMRKDRGKMKANRIEVNGANGDKVPHVSERDHRYEISVVVVVQVMSARSLLKICPPIHVKPLPRLVPGVVAVLAFSTLALLSADSPAPSPSAVETCPSLPESVDLTRTVRSYYGSRRKME